MRITTLITLLACCFGHLMAQKIRCDIDSVNNSLLLTSEFMSYCSLSKSQAESNERDSLSLGYYSSPLGSLYVIGLPIVSDEAKTVRRGYRLKFVIQRNDTISLRCSSEVTSIGKYHGEGDTTWVAYPEYTLSEKNLRRLMKENVQFVLQETDKGKYLRINPKDCHRWRLPKTLNTIYKELNKAKPEKTGAEMLFNAGRYQYVKEDTVISTQKGLSFSEKWMY